MIRPILGWLLSLAQRLVDDTIPEEALQLYIRDSLERLVGSSNRGLIPEGEKGLSSIPLALRHLPELGLDGLPAYQSETSTEPGDKLGGESHRNVIQKGMISREAIGSLFQAVDQHKPLNEAQKIELEALLRYIEVRRNAGLRFTGTRSEHERWVSAAQTSILFSRYAKHEGDFRFLNTALKLNDWAYRYFRKRGSQHEELIYLHALLEAETGLMEIMA